MTHLTITDTLCLAPALTGKLAVSQRIVRKFMQRSLGLTAVLAPSNEHIISQNPLT
jgi:hypothetical protein